jgi:RHS repeat-associated protein
MIGVRFARSDSTVATRYFVKDHLGSIAVITNEAGAVAERLSYDAWGKRRNTDGTDDVSNILTAQTTRGFTGHEMIDEVDLVNMNGRVYDPVLGRFISADPFIHEVTNSQDLNRYSYVHNNPLSYTDMNGYGFFKSLGSFFKKIWKPLLAILVAVILQRYELIPKFLALLGTPAKLIQPLASGISSGVTNVIATGKPKAFLSGFGQGLAVYGVGHGLFGGVGENARGFFGVTAYESSQFGSAAYVGKAVAHGVVGGAFSAIRGGSFKSGFLAAGFSSAVAPFGPDPLTQLWKGAAFSAAAGGVGSVLGGGKFADGAVTGAFTYLYNEAASGRIENRESLRNQRDALAEEINAEIQALSAEEQKWEWGAVIYFETSDTLTRSELGAIPIKV